MSKITKTSFVPTQLLCKLPQQSKVCEITPLRQYRYGITTDTKPSQHYIVFLQKMQMAICRCLFAL